MRGGLALTLGGGLVGLQLALGTAMALLAAWRLRPAGAPMPPR